MISFKLRLSAVLMCLLIGGLASKVQSNQNVHNYSMKSVDGDEIDFSQYEGKVLLIVNTASRCGYTPQYRSMEKLYQKYKAKGLEVMAFPANDFNGQEPGTNEEIKKFCFMKYKTSFPILGKSSVKGPDINPLYKYLTEETPFKGPITWNFNKFLVNANGEVVARYGSSTDPLSDQIVKKIESILPK